MDEQTIISYHNLLNKLQAQINAQAAEISHQRGVIAQQQALLGARAVTPPVEEPDGDPV